MQTTITTDEGTVKVEPHQWGEGVQITVQTVFGDFATMDLSPEQLGALVFALEKAEEQRRIAKDREAEHFASHYPNGITA